MEIYETKTVDTDGAEQFNQLVRFESALSGFTTAGDDYTRSVYGVQITCEPGGHGDFIGVYDLDGEQLNLPNPGSWELVDGATEAVDKEALAAFKAVW